MLPVALTCPLWWVARWATRVLTSLAVLSLALGAAPALLPASTAPAPPPTIRSLALAESLGPSTATLSTVLGASADAGSARSVDPQPALNDALTVLPGPPVVGTSGRTGAEPSLRAAGPAGRASRAPPA